MHSNEEYQSKVATLFETEAVPHFLVIKRLALYLVRNQAAADDLVQETYVQALKSFDRYEPGTNCRAWLCKILFYKRSQWIRSNLRYRQLDDDAVQIPAKSSSNPTLPPTYIGKRVSTALLSMPEKSMRIVWLSLVEEFTYREIADFLDIPIGTVMSRIHRGRKTLRSQFLIQAKTKTID